MLSIDPDLIPAWDEAMIAAEAVRLQHPEAMDYLKAMPVGESEPETRGEDLATVAQDSSDITRWFELAIQVEEMQYVFD